MMRRLRQDTDETKEADQGMAEGVPLTTWGSARFFVSFGGMINSMMNNSMKT